MYQYQLTGRFFAQCADGLEQLTAEELSGLGSENVTPSFRGVYFDGGAEALYRIVYTSHIASRVLAPLITFDCHSTKYLYKTAKSVTWSDFMTTKDTFAVMASAAHSKIRHSRHAALVIKDAIADWFRDREGVRPSVDTKNPDVQLHLRIEDNRAIISLDAGGGPMHRREYRKHQVEAPMQETLAAAIIRLSGWNGECPLYDPFCGSGTLLAEALMHVCRIPSGYRRKNFGLTRLPDYDDALWQRIRSEANDRIKPLPDRLIAGSDISTEAMAATRGNLSFLPGGKNIAVKKLDYCEIESLNDQVIVMNPPYGLRSVPQEDMASFYHELGEFLKHRCTGSSAYIYFGERSLLRSMALRKTWKRDLKNGGLDGTLCKFELY